MRVSTVPKFPALRGVLLYQTYTKFHAELAELELKLKAMDTQMKRETRIEIKKWK